MKLTISPSLFQAMFIDPNRNFLWHYPHNGYTYIIDKFQVATGQTYKMEFTQTLINNKVRMNVLEMFYLNTIEQLFLFVEQLDQLEVCLPYGRLLTGIPILPTNITNIIKFSVHT